MSEVAPRSPVASVACLLAGPVAAFAVYWLIPPEAAGGLAHAGRAAAGVAALMGVWWVTEAIPLEVTGLVPLVLLPLLGVSEIKEAAAPYATDIIFLFLGGMLLGQAMEVWGLHRRLALTSLSLVGGRPTRIVLGFLVVTAFLSMWVSNTAATVMMLPIGASVVGVVAPSLAKEGAGAFGAAVVLAIAFGATIGGVGTVIGTPPITQYVGFMRSSAGVSVTFVDWMWLGLPTLAIVLPVTWIVLTRVAFRVPGAEIAGVRELMSSQRRALGPLSRGEWSVLCVFACAAVGWIALPLIARADSVAGTTLGRVLASTKDAVIAIGAAMALFLIPVNLRARRFVLSWHEAHQVPWGILLLFGGGLSMAESLRSTGVDRYIASLATPLSGVPLPLVLLVFSSVTIVLTEFSNNTALVAAGLPVAAAIAEKLGVPAAPILVTMTLAASLGFMLPGGTAPNALVFASGRVTMRQMMRGGAWLDVTGALLVPALVWSAWKLGMLPGGASD